MRLRLTSAMPHATCLRALRLARHDKRERGAAAGLARRSKRQLAVLPKQPPQLRSTGRGDASVGKLVQAACINV
jgi:hypothetical protein